MIFIKVQKILIIYSYEIYLIITYFRVEDKDGIFMKLKTKILAGFLTISAMLAVAGLWSITRMNWMGENVENILENNYKSINAAKGMIKSLEREDSAILMIINGEAQKYQNVLLPADSIFAKHFAIAKNNITIPGEEKIIENIEKLYPELKAKLSVANGKPIDKEWYFSEVHESLLAVMEEAENLQNINDEEMYKTAKNISESAERALMPGIIAIIAAIVFSLIFSYMINYYLIKPIRDITKEITKFIKVKKSFNYEAESRDEIYELANSVRLLTSRATEIDRQV